MVWLQLTSMDQSTDSIRRASVGRWNNLWKDCFFLWLPDDTTGTVRP